MRHRSVARHASRPRSIVAVACAVVAATFLFACAGTALAAEGPDWQHALKVAAYLAAKPTQQPVVLLFGGSAARECIPSETSWADAVAKKLGGSRVTVGDLGSRNQTFAQDTQLLNLMKAKGATFPKGGIVLIGLGPGRFTPAKYTTQNTLPTASAKWPDYSNQHQYSQSHILSLSQKQTLAQQWAATRYSLFTHNYARNLADLKTLVSTCLKMGLHPVIIDLPRNMQVIGGNSAFKKAIAKYEADSAAAIAAANKSLSAGQKIPPVVDFVAKAHLVNSNFYDLYHLVEPGRVKWQPLLAQETADLVNRYKLLSAAAPVASGGGSGSTSASAPGGSLDLGAVAPGLISLV